MNDPNDKGARVMAGHRGCLICYLGGPLDQQWKVLPERECTSERVYPYLEHLAAPLQEAVYKRGGPYPPGETVWYFFAGYRKIEEEEEGEGEGEGQ